MVERDDGTTPVVGKFGADSRMVLDRSRYVKKAEGGLAVKSCCENDLVPMQ